MKNNILNQGHRGRTAIAVVCAFGKLASLMAIVVLASSVSNAQEAKPRMYFVKVAKASVHCGPNDNYYPTTILQRGTSVEVYHESDDGWAAIRPPQDSFNWLAAENAYLLPGGTIAEVVDKPQPAWIGSSVGTPKRYRWQVELQPSQQLRVLGESRQAIEDGKEKLWYKVAPPQGEFRWIPMDALDDQPVAPDQMANNKPKRVKLANSDATADEDDSEVVAAQYSGEEIVLGPVLNSRDEFVEADEKLYAPNAPRQDGSQEVIVGEEFPTEEYMGEEYAGEEYVGEPSIEEPMSFGGPGCLGCLLGKLGCGCSCGHAPTDGMFVHKLNGILGYVGFGVARLPVDSQPVTLSGAFQPVEQVPARIDHLPRPVRRNRITKLNSSTLGGFRSILNSQSSTDGTPLAPEASDAQSLLVQNNAPIGTGIATASASVSRESDWHAIHPASSVAAPNAVEMAAYTSDSSNTSNNLIPTPISRNAPAGSPQALQFTTPHLQQSLVELSQIVAQPIEQWELASLRASALRWIDQGNSAIERGEARLLLERIDQFESLRTRMNASNNGVVLTGGTVPGNVPSGPSPYPPVEPSLPGDAKQADATGWLTQVHTSQPGQPEFALTDLSGKVIAYVKPAPGVNLRRYNREAVAIYGARGYLPSLAAKQIIAERVVRIR